MTIKQLSYTAEQPGPHLVILGAVHGNETCGTQAIARIIEQLDNQTLALAKGRLTLVPVANPKAYQQGKRFIERNLNRYLYPKPDPVHYEDFLTPVICRILDEADALLDLHSYPSPGGAFCFLGRSSEAEIAFCHALGIEHFVYGWSEAFGAANKKDNDRYESMGTTEYMRFKGAMATTLECGSHYNNNRQADKNIEVGYGAILKALQHFKMIPLCKSEGLQSDAHYIKMQSIFYKEKPGRLTKDWQHLDYVTKGTVIALYDDGQTLSVEQDGYLVLPMLGEEYPVGSEWFYFGIKTEKPEVIVNGD